MKNIQFSLIVAISVSFTLVVSTTSFGITFGHRGNAYTDRSTRREYSSPQRLLKAFLLAECLDSSLTSRGEHAIYSDSGWINVNKMNPVEGDNNVEFNTGSYKIISGYRIRKVNVMRNRDSAVGVVTFSHIGRHERDSVVLDIPRTDTVVYGMKKVKHGEWRVVDPPLIQRIPCKRLLEFFKLDTAEHRFIRFRDTTWTPEGVHALFEYNYRVLESVCGIKK